MSRPNAVPSLPALPASTARVSAWDGVRVLLWRIRGYRYSRRRATSAVEYRFAHTSEVCWSAIATVLLLGPLLLTTLQLAFHVRVTPFSLLTSAALWYPVVPLVLTAFLRVPPFRTYMSRDRRAVLVTRGTTRGWTVEEFFTASPGTASAAPLWNEVIPALIDAADAQHVTVTATATNASVAAYYTSLVPGLHPRTTQRAGSRVQLIRRPKPASH